MNPEDFVEVIPNGEQYICVLFQGNVLYGTLYQIGTQFKLINGCVIRNWGTTNGLGELAKNGPTNKTKLDPCNGTIIFSLHNVVYLNKCENQTKWTY